MANLTINGDLIADNIPLIQAVTTTSTNLDDYKTAGIYYFSSSYTPTNIPAGVNGWLVVLATANTPNKQIWFRQGTNGTNDMQAWVRTCNSSTWSEWNRLATYTAVDNSVSTDTLTPTNYVRFDSGLTICWGSLDISTASTGQQTVTFPIAFSAVDKYAIIKVPVSTRGGGNYAREDFAYAKTTTSFTIYWNTGINILYNEWVAIGYSD